MSRSPIPINSPSIYDVRTEYFGFGFGNWDLNNLPTRELAGKRTGSISLGDLRGAAHARWSGLDESGGAWHKSDDKSPPDAGNWQRTANGWDETYWDWNNNFLNSNVSILANSDSILLSHVQEGPPGGKDSSPSAIGINGYFVAEPQKTYSFFIQWVCRVKAGHDYAGNERPVPHVSAGFAGFDNGYQDPENIYFAFPNGDPGEVGVNYQENPTVGQTVTWQGSFTTRSNALHIVPYFNIFQGGIEIGESATFNVEVLEHKIWQTN